MPLDDGCRLHQHHGVQGLRPDPVKPYPKQPVCGEKPNPTFALPPQDRHLMPKGDEFEFQAGAATKAEREQRKEGGNHSNHAHHATMVAPKSLRLATFQSFERGQGKISPVPLRRFAYWMLVDWHATTRCGHH